MSIAKANTEILNQLQSIVKSLDNDEYSQETAVLSGASIGKHIRHIIEFYSCLLNGVSKNIIDYDLRERNVFLETNANYTTAYIDDIKNKLSVIKSDKSLQLYAAFSVDSDIKFKIQTTFYRELAYTVEHAIHHMAIIKIAINADFKHIQLPDNFGIAYSTLKHQQSQCAQ